MKQVKGFKYHRKPSSREETAENASRQTSSRDFPCPSRKKLFCRKAQRDYDENLLSTAIPDLNIPCKTK
jgi:hypothetical protein